MAFSSPLFLFAFLPLVLGLYYLIPQKGKNLTLLVMSLLFYTWGEKELVFIMMTSVLVDYGCALWIEKGYRKTGLAISLIVNLGLLGFFKYASFTFDNYLALLDLLGIAHESAQKFPTLILPLGISFYTFQTLSYTIDVYKGKVKANRNFIDFATFVTLFPQLIAGPIVRYKQIHKQLQNRRENKEQFAEGVERFIIGLAKKVIIADSLKPLVALAFDSPGVELTMGMAWFGAFVFMLQLYYDFAAYSDMAIGMGKMFGFELPENFNYPFISRSVQESWQRWHLTLSNWFRDYVYFPLRKTKWGRTHTGACIMILFLLIGMWHGASWTFFAFGLFQGGLIVVERFVIKKGWNSSWKPLSHIYYVWNALMAMTMFRANDLSQLWEFIRVMYGFGNLEWNFSHPYFNTESFLVIGIAVIFSLPFYPWLQKNMKRLKEKKARLHRVIQVVFSFFLLALLVLCAAYISATVYEPFIYFRF